MLENHYVCGACSTIASSKGIKEFRYFLKAGVLVYNRSLTTLTYCAAIEENQRMYRASIKCVSLYHAKFLLIHYPKFYDKIYKFVFIIISLRHYPKGKFLPIWEK